MLQEIQRVVQIPELRSKILFTLLMLAVCRIGDLFLCPESTAKSQSAFSATPPAEAKIYFKWSISSPAAHFPK